ncbi:hypothetical protein F4780DRAFT_606267 [Xylariomycetidae sp. FL0641]|nr:hypothetical protein F4780DRAFT_606267 [Xylariomycetidae sp. FL0641]
MLHTGAHLIDQQNPSWPGGSHSLSVQCLLVLFLATAVAHVLSVHVPGRVDLLVRQQDHHHPPPPPQDGPLLSLTASARKKAMRAMRYAAVFAGASRLQVALINPLPGTEYKSRGFSLPIYIVLGLAPQNPLWPLPTRPHPRPVLSDDAAAWLYVGPWVQRVVHGRRQGSLRHSSAHVPSSKALILEYVLGYIPCPSSLLASLAHTPIIPPIP